MPEQPSVDKLARVREAGALIHGALAENVKARIGEVVSMEDIHETRDSLVAVLKMYLQHIMPEVTITCEDRITPSMSRPVTLAFTLKVDGRLTVSISLYREDTPPSIENKTEALP